MYQKDVVFLSYEYVSGAMNRHKHERIACLRKTLAFVCICLEAAMPGSVKCVVDACLLFLHPAFKKAMNGLHSL